MSEPNSPSIPSPPDSPLSPIEEVPKFIFDNDFLTDDYCVFWCCKTGFDDYMKRLEKENTHIKILYEVTIGSRYFVKFESLDKNLTAHCQKIYMPPGECASASGAMLSTDTNHHGVILMERNYRKSKFSSTYSKVDDKSNSENKVQYHTLAHLSDKHKLLVLIHYCNECDNQICIAKINCDEFMIRTVKFISELNDDVTYNSKNMLLGGSRRKGMQDILSKIWLEVGKKQRNFIDEKPDAKRTEKCEYNTFHSFEFYTAHKDLQKILCCLCENNANHSGKHYTICGDCESGKHRNEVNVCLLEICSKCKKDLNVEQGKALSFPDGDVFEIAAVVLSK